MTDSHQTNNVYSETWSHQTKSESIATNIDQYRDDFDLVSSSTEDETLADNSLPSVDYFIDHGYDVWVKEASPLGPNSTIEVKSYCVIDPEGVENRGYEVFNTYDGSRGSNSKKRMKYFFTKKMTIDKKIKTLVKKGYRRASESENLDK